MNLTVIKSFECLVPKDLKDVTGPLLDLLRFAYRANGSAEDAVKLGPHFIRHHFDHLMPNSRILWALPPLPQTPSIRSLPSLVEHQPPDCPATAGEAGEHLLIKNHPPWAFPEVCCLSTPLLHECTSVDPSVKLLEFTDDPSLIDKTFGIAFY